MSNFKSTAGGISHNVCSLRLLSTGDKFRLPNTSVVLVVVLKDATTTEFSNVYCRVEENPKLESVSCVRVPLPGESVAMVNQNIIPLE